jgi:mannose-6-phosphate isomerase-like protein (cupin superfamily)
VETKILAELMAFDDAKMRKNVIFESPHMFCDLYCLMPGQAQKVHAHDGSDKVYVVLEGTARVTVGTDEADLGPGQAAIARAGEPHGVRNEGAERLVVLVTMAPRP